MRALTIEESFDQFVAEPTPERWLELRERVLASDEFDPYGSAWRRVDALIASDRFAEARDLACSLEPWACLSPRWHFWMGVTAWELGDPLVAAQHREWLQVCLQALLDSGAGRPDAPYLVLYTSDAYDVLQALGEIPAGQQLVESQNGTRDVLMAESGEAYWFDVADLLAHCTPPSREEVAGETLVEPVAKSENAGTKREFSGRGSS